MELLVGTVLGVVGLALALYQIRKVERAAIAAKQAVEQSAHQVNTISLLLLIPELALIERQLELAAAAEDTDEARRLVREWLHQAGDLRGLLSVHSSLTDDLPEKVQTSISLASVAQRELNKNKSPSGGTRRLRESASEIVVLARSESSRIRASIEAPAPLPTFLDDVRGLGQRIRQMRGKVSSHG